MLPLRPTIAFHRKPLWQSSRWTALPRRRGILTLAIETSCDDTSVALVEKNQKTGTAKIHFCQNVTANLTEYRGIHPIKALESHQENLAKLIQNAITFLPSPDPKASHPIQSLWIEAPDKFGNPQNLRKPDFISVTRGPGMRSSLFTGLDTAKALAVAWQIPFMAVHHMQAHLLTPRLVSAVVAHLKEPKTAAEGDANLTSTSASISNADADADADANPNPQPNVYRPVIDHPFFRPDKKTLEEDGDEPRLARPQPQFPFLSLLASGGHTMLVSSTGLTKHEVLAETADIAVGEALDKAARMILPDEILEKCRNTMYGKYLEQFAFPNGPSDYADYVAPTTRGEEIDSSKKVSKYGWYLTVPFAQTRTLEFSFASLETAVTNIVRKRAKELKLPPAPPAEEKKKKEEPKDPFEATGPGIHRFVDPSAKPEEPPTPAGLEERRLLAREAMRVCFEHLASRIVIALDALSSSGQNIRRIKALVVSGGVGANNYLTTVLSSFLQARGYNHITIIAPPAWLCTDNAAMIGWAGIEMFESGWRGEIDVKALQKWSLETDGVGDESWGKQTIELPPMPAVTRPQIINTTTYKDAKRAIRMREIFHQTEREARREKMFRREFNRRRREVVTKRADILWPREGGVSGGVQSGGEELEREQIWRDEVGGKQPPPLRTPWTKDRWGWDEKEGKLRQERREQAIRQWEGQGREEEGTTEDGDGKKDDWW
ncbi:glycoprotease family-domain-containing protein [Aspergillus karnatakaensis]|uniref:N(6)-L-threonylcarbamoyladenine synthase family protein n=1 Tax=Aspergillus karnatakaensis TaxID=1810916 RepID=UPI003CCD9F8D